MQTSTDSAIRRFAAARWAPVHHRASRPRPPTGSSQAQVPVPPQRRGHEHRHAGPDGGCGRQMFLLPVIGLSVGVGCGLPGRVGAEADSDGLVVAALLGMGDVGQHPAVGSSWLSAEG